MAPTGWKTASSEIPAEPTRVSIRVFFPWSYRGILRSGEGVIPEPSSRARLDSFSVVPVEGDIFCKWASGRDDSIQTEERGLSKAGGYGIYRHGEQWRLTCGRVQVVELQYCVALEAQNFLGVMVESCRGSTAEAE